MRLRPLDLLVFLSGLALVILSSVLVYSGGSGELSVVISGDEGEWVYPLSEDRTLEVSGILGFTVVEIEGGNVHFHSSPCPNQTCVASGAIRAAGQWLACLPNGVFVRIEGGSSDDEPDAGAY